MFCFLSLRYRNFSFAFLSFFRKPPFRSSCCMFILNFMQNALFYVIFMRFFPWFLCLSSVVNDSALPGKNKYHRHEVIMSWASRRKMLGICLISGLRKPCFLCRRVAAVDGLLMLNELYDCDLGADLMFYTCEFSDCLMIGRKFASIEAVGEQSVRMIVWILLKINGWSFKSIV